MKPNQTKNHRMYVEDMKLYVEKEKSTHYQL